MRCPFTTVSLSCLWSAHTKRPCTNAHCASWIELRIKIVHCITFLPNRLGPKANRTRWLHLSVAIAFTSLFVLSACDKDSSFLVERRAGPLVKTDTVAGNGIVVRAELYDIAQYKPERVVSFSCKPALNADSTTSEQSGDPQNLTRRGSSEEWLKWVVASVGPDSNMRDFPPWNDLPLDRVHVVSAKFAYIDVGPNAVGVTFDGCRTTMSLSRLPFEAGLFVKNELKREFQLLPRPFYSDYRVTSGESGVCFRVNPWYVNQPFTGFDVCTMNRGVTWYSKLSDGALSAPTTSDVELIYSAVPVTFKFEDRGRLFPRGELKSSGREMTSPFFTAHRFTPDTSGVCSRINPLALTDGQKVLDVCTADNGATWYTKLANGPLRPPMSDDASKVYSASTPTPTFLRGDVLQNSSTRGASAPIKPSSSTSSTRKKSGPSPID